MTRSATFVLRSLTILFPPTSIAPDDQHHRQQCGADQHDHGPDQNCVCISRSGGVVIVVLGSVVLGLCGIGRLVRGIGSIRFLRFLRGVRSIGLLRSRGLLRFIGFVRRRWQRNGLIFKGQLRQFLRLAVRRKDDGGLEFTVRCLYENQDVVDLFIVNTSIILFSIKNTSVCILQIWLC